MNVDIIKRTISVTGVGRAAAAADILLLDLAVETQAATASEALAGNNKQTVAVLSALKDHGIQEHSDDSAQHQSSIRATRFRRHEPAEDCWLPSPERYERQVTRPAGSRRHHRCRGSSGRRRDTHRWYLIFLRRPFRFARRSPEAGYSGCECPGPTAGGRIWCRTRKRYVDVRVEFPRSTAGPGVPSKQRRRHSHLTR